MRYQSSKYIYSNDRMNIQDAQVVVIRNNIQTYDLFEAQSGIMALPKREFYNMINEGVVGHTFDNRVSPDKRNPKYYKAASRWATHHAILSLFVKSNHDWLFLIEDSRALSEDMLKTIEELVKPGLNLFSPDASCYAVDKITAKIITRNIEYFYAPFEESLEDVEKLKLMDIHRHDIVKKFNSYSLWFSYLPLFCGFLLALFLFFMLCPYDRFFTEGSVRLAKMLGSKEAVVSGKG